MQMNRYNLNVVLVRAGIVAIYSVCLLAGIANAMIEESYLVDPTVRPGADINVDDIVDSIDLSLFAGDWCSTDPNMIADTDFNNDDIVNLADFSVFAQGWGWQLPTGAVMKALVTKYASEPGDELHPFTGVEVIIHNISANNTDYEMDEVNFNVGTNNGVNWIDVPDGWLYDDVTNPDKILTRGDSALIAPMESDIFYVYVIGSEGEDPANFGFKKDYVTAKTRYEENFPALEIDLPERKD